MKSRIHIEPSGISIVGGTARQFFYTHAGTEVSERVKTNQTILFEDYSEAFEYAQSRKTYVYDLWSNTNEETRVWLCYGVPVR